MTGAAVTVLALKASIALLVFGLGLQATPRDTTHLFRHPALLARSLLSMNVVMPLAAVVVALMFRVHPAVKLALITLAISPVPPFLPGKTMKAGGTRAYTIGLLTATSLLSIVVVPVTLWVLGVFLRVPFHVSLGAIVRIVGGSVLIPLLIGIMVRRFAPASAERAAKPITSIATVLLVLAMIPILFTAWPAIKTLVGNGTILAIIVLAFAGLGIGHYLGGPDRDDRTVLALATAARHPGVALAIGTAMFPGNKLVVAAVLLDLIITALISLPYVKRSTQVHATSSAHAHDGEHDDAAAHAGRGNNHRG